MGTGYQIYCKNCFPKGETAEDEKKENYSFYQISTGGGFFCFCKEQLEQNYMCILDCEPETIEIIKEKINEGFIFGETVGYLPYYCEKCKILDNRYYFEMYKDNEKYLPDYKCKVCEERLKSAVVIRELRDSGSWAGNLAENKVGDLQIYIRNNRLKIIDDEKNEYFLICKKCNGSIFCIDQNIMWD